MAEAPEQADKTEAPTAKRRREAAERGDVLQSRELGTALVVLAGVAWLAFAGPLLMGALRDMLTAGLTFDSGVIRDFRPGEAMLRLIGQIAIPIVALFAITLVAAIATPAVLGSLGFRSGAFAFKPGKLNPMAGLKRIFGRQGLIELGKSVAKVALIGAIGLWLLNDQARALAGLSAEETRTALGSVGHSFVLAMLVMAAALLIIAMIDVPAQLIQRSARLRMSKQEIKDESKQTEGSPELRAAIRRRQHEVLRGSARKAVAEATLVLTNPTHYAVALRYRLGEDSAPLVVAKGRGATAEAIRTLAGESKVPILSYPQLARAIYYTSRNGQVIREDLYMAVATVIAFVFNLDTAAAAGAAQPAVEVPAEARFDEQGRPEA